MTFNSNLIYARFLHFHYYNSVASKTRLPVTCSLSNSSFVQFIFDHLEHFRPASSGYNHTFGFHHFLLSDLMIYRGSVCLVMSHRASYLLPSYLTLRIALGRQVNGDR
jgi:hypothetical protein